MRDASRKGPLDAVGGAGGALDGRDEVKGSSNRTFGIVFTVVFLIVAAWPLLRSEGPRLWSLSVAVLFLTAAIVQPRVLAPLNRLWTALGLLLHRVVNPVVMGILFFLVVTPMGLAMRLFGRDPLRLRRDAEADSYWIERNPPGPPPESVRNQY